MNSEDSQSHSEDEGEVGLEEEVVEEVPSPGASKKKKKGKRRGRQSIPIKWSRIVAIDDADLDGLTVWHLDPDLEEAVRLLPTMASRKHEDWRPGFITEDFLAG